MHIIAQKSVYIYPRYGKLIKNTNDSCPAVPGDSSCTVRCVSLHPLGMLDRSLVSARLMEFDGPQCGGDAPAGSSCPVRSVSCHHLGMLGIATFQKEQTFWLSRHCEGSLLPVAIRYSIMFALHPCLPP